MDDGLWYNHEHDEYIHGVDIHLWCIEVASGIKITIEVNDGMWYNHEYDGYPWCWYPPMVYRSGI